MWKSLIRYPVDIRRARRLLSRENESDAAGLRQRPISLVLRTGRMMIDGGRHLAAIARHSIDAGSTITLCCDDRTLATVARKPYGAKMLAMAGLDYQSDITALAAGSFVLCDTDLPVTPGAIRIQIGRTVDPAVPVMPYPMHPSTVEAIARIESDDSGAIDRLRELPRECRIYFAGNQKARYGDEKMGREFGVANRLQLIQAVRAAYPNRVTDSLDRIGQAVDSNKPADIAIVDSRTQPCPAPRWPLSMASADFFLCCPGSSQPTCHHLVEAMRVGTIPILEYGDRITPGLQDGVNAICFSGTHGLVDAIARIDRLDPLAIKRMHRSVADFYDQHLCVTTFLADLRDGRLDDAAGRICLPFHDRDLFDVADACQRDARADDRRAA